MIMLCTQNSYKAEDTNIEPEQQLDMTGLSTTRVPSPTDHHRRPKGADSKAPNISCADDSKAVDL